jgi:hypothetical protein
LSEALASFDVWTMGLQHDYISNKLKITQRQLLKTGNKVQNTKGLA